MKADEKQQIEHIVTGQTGADIQQAIDAVAKQGGGRVVVPAGEWVSGTLWMKSHVELHLEKGAVIKGSTQQADYNRNDEFPENFHSVGEEWSGGHLILGYRVEDVAITGEGVIDGNGPAFFGECEEDSRFPWYKYGLKLHPADRTWYRPGPMVAFFLCKDIRIEGVCLKDTPAWTCHIRCTDGVTLRGVRIDADRTIANSDGFSIDCTKNVLMEKCVLLTGDDAVAIRAACSQEGHAEAHPSENIRIRDCDISSCCYGIRFGIGTGTIRDIVVENCRIHEASDAAFGFSPAWVNAPKNCYIEDITIRNCEVWDCVRPVSAGLAGNSKVEGILLENCVFHTMLPSVVRQGCAVTFRNCVRNTITRFKVRSRLNWCDQEIRKKQDLFIDAKASNQTVIEACQPIPLAETGVLLLAFDDENYANWEAALPLFKRYDAHASFFMSGQFGGQAVSTAKKLIEAGHTVGLHGLRHKNVPEAIAEMGKDGWWNDEVALPKRRADVSYVPIRSFAYPNNRNTDETDAFLLTRFERLRTGIPGVRPYQSTEEQAKAFQPLAEDDRLFFPSKDLPNHRVLGGVIMGEAYRTDIEDVLNCIRRAAARKEVILFTSHGISPGAGHIHMKTEWLEAILAEAQKQGVQVVGFDDLP